MGGHDQENVKVPRPGTDLWLKGREILKSIRKRRNRPGRKRGVAGGKGKGRLGRGRFLSGNVGEEGDKSTGDGMELSTDLHGGYNI